MVFQKNYGSWHSIATWYPEVTKELSTIISMDLDAGYDAMDRLYSTEDKIGNYIQKVRETVNKEDWGLITN